MSYVGEERNYPSTSSPLSYTQLFCDGPVHSNSLHLSGGGTAYLYKFIEQTELLILPDTVLSICKYQFLLKPHDLPLS